MSQWICLGRLPPGSRVAAPMRYAEETSAEQLSRTTTSKPTRTSGLTARFPRPDAQPAEKTRMPRRGECSRALDLFEEAVLAIVHHLRSKSRMHMKFAIGNRSQPKGRSLLHVRISLGSLSSKFKSYTSWKTGLSLPGLPHWPYRRAGNSPLR